MQGLTPGLPRTTRLLEWRAEWRPQGAHAPVEDMGGAEALQVVVFHLVMAPLRIRPSAGA